MNLSKNIQKSIVFILLFITVLSFSSCMPSSPITKSDFALNTIVSITFYNSKDAACFDGCMNICRKYENLFSKTISGSDIDRINQSEGTGVEVSEETAFLIEESLKYCNLTDGAVDITVAPVTDLWNFSDIYEGKRPPEDSEIKSLLGYIDYKSVCVDGNTVSLSNPDSAIELGFIAKGYIADQIKDYVISQGVQRCIINLGGNIVTVDNRTNPGSFTIGIRKPFDDNGNTIDTVKVINKSVVTSGIYERSFTCDGTLYHHIINPKTGYPVSNNLCSVTIISDDSAKGDALSTTCLCLGLDKGMELINNTDDVEAVFVTDEYELFYSENLENLYKN